MTGEFVPKSDRVKELFKDVFIPSAADWAELREKVQADGLYHQNRLAVAPNGSISYINDVSASIHPITQRIEERQEKKIGKIYYPAAGLSTDWWRYWNFVRILVHTWFVWEACVIRSLIRNLCTAVFLHICGQVCASFDLRVEC